MEAAAVAPNYFLLFGIAIIIIGFALKFDSIAVIVISAVVTSLIAGIPLLDIIKLLGKSFVNARYMSLFFIILPVIGICERYGLREQATILIQKLKLVTTGRLLIIYQAVRVIAGAASLRVGGHPQFVRPLVEPMAHGAAERETTVDEELNDTIKSASAAAENYGNFFGQNLFFASGGNLLILGTLKGQGYDIAGTTIAFWAIPVALSALVIGAIQFLYLDKKIKAKGK